MNMTCETKQDLLGRGHTQKFSLFFSLFFTPERKIFHF